MTFVFVAFAWVTAVQRVVSARDTDDVGLKRTRLAAAGVLFAIGTLIATNSPALKGAQWWPDQSVAFEVLTLVQQGAVLAAAASGGILVAGFGPTADAALSRTVQRTSRRLVVGAVAVGAVMAVLVMSDSSPVRKASHIYEYTLYRASDPPFSIGLLVVQGYALVTAVAAVHLVGKHTRLSRRRTDTVSMRMLQVACALLGCYAAVRIVLLVAATAYFLNVGDLRVGFTILTYIAAVAVLTLCLTFAASPIAELVSATGRLRRQRHLFDDAVAVVPKMKPDRKIGGWSVRRVADTRATAVFDILTVLLTHPSARADAPSDAEGDEAGRAGAVAAWLDRGLADPMPLRWLTPPPGMSPSRWLQEIIDRRASAVSPFSRQKEKT